MTEVKYLWNGPHASLSSGTGLTHSWGNQNRKKCIMGVWNADECVRLSPVMRLRRASSITWWSSSVAPRHELLTVNPFSPEEKTRCERNSDEGVCSWCTETFRRDVKPFMVRRRNDPRNDLCLFLLSSVGWGRFSLSAHRARRERTDETMWGLIWSS